MPSIYGEVIRREDTHSHYRKARNRYPVAESTNSVRFAPKVGIPDIQGARLVISSAELSTLTPSFYTKWHHPFYLALPVSTRSASFTAATITPGTARFSASKRAAEGKIHAQIVH
jgi:hypothetical protein